MSSRIFRFWAAFAGVALTLTALPIASAGAAPLADPTGPPAPQLPATVSADSLPTVQVNGVVWDQVIVGNTVYVTGSFTKARPAGAAAGVNEVDRQNALAYTLSTGQLINTWAPALNAQGRAITASADGTQIYIGGDFTRVGDTVRNRIASVDAASGTVIGGFNPNASGTVNSIQLSGNTAYIGGAFTTMSNQGRTRLASVDATTGALSSWSPTADNEVLSLTIPQGSGKVIAAGLFDHMSGATTYSMGALDAVTGAVLPWAATDVVRNTTGDTAIWSLSSTADAVFGTGMTFGDGGNFEGTFSADSATGQLNWVNGTRGDTYDSVPVNGILYSVSHTHDAGMVGGNPQTDPWTFQRAYATTESASPLGRVNQGGDFNGRPASETLPWLPTIALGTYTGMYQGAWTIEANNDWVIIGGEFPRVNGQAQYGLARFPARDRSPNKEGPQGWDELTPQLLNLAPGAVRVSWTAAWDRDDSELTYEVLRGATQATSTVLQTVKKSTSWWNRPTMSFVDTTAPPGTSQTYRIRVSDPSGNIIPSAASTITVQTGTATSSQYLTSVNEDGPSSYWRLDEPSGTSSYDWAGGNDLTLNSNIQRGRPGAMLNDSDTASRFQNLPSSGQSASSKDLQPGPATFTIETWIKTNTSNGGKIIGFGNSNTNNSSSYDRHIYMSNNGRLNFGVYPGSTVVVTSANSYNDNNWHHVAASLGSEGMRLYVDGNLVGRNDSVTTAQAYSGYWRVGGDTLSSWPNAGSSSRFTGDIDDVAIYSAPLSADRIRAHYQASGRTGTWPVAPSDPYGQAVWNDGATSFLRLDETSGSNFSDVITAATGAQLSGNATVGQAGSPANTTGRSVRLNSNQARIVGTQQVSNPQTFSYETWFRTTTTQGGRIIGFGSSQSATSNNYDRHVYMLNDGRLRYGIYDGQERTIDTPGAYNDGGWHYLAVTQGQDGMRLYVDGALQASGSSNVAENYSGYWRLGNDNTWSGASSKLFVGDLDEAAIYSGILSPAQVLNHWALGGGNVPNQAPVAAFTSSHTDLKASLDGSGSTDPDGTVASWAWDFGDGQTGTGSTVDHTYAAAGTYPVTLVVTDNKGATATISHDVIVTEPAPNQAPVAAFTSSHTDLKASFNGSGSTDPDGTVASWAWDFGDGQTGTGDNVDHTYAAAGTYPVTLVVTDNKGATATISHDVIVTEPVPVTFFGLDTFSRTVSNGLGSADLGGNWTLTGAASSFSVANGVGRAASGKGQTRGAMLGSISAQDMEINMSTGYDKVQTGGGSFLSVIGRQVSSGTNYRLDLRTASNNTVMAQLIRTVGGTETALATVASLPGLTYAPGDTLRIKFQVEGSGTTSLRAKVWKDGQVEPAAWTIQSTDTTTVLQAKGSAGFSNYLSGSATNGPISLLVDEFDVGPLNASPELPNQNPVASFTSSGTGLTASLDGSGSSDPDGAVTAWAWNFGDGQTGTGANVDHTYAAAGTYPVTLVVTDNKGATATISHDVTVTEPAPVTFFGLDTFSRTVSNGLGTAEIGGNWALTGAATSFSVANGVGSAASAKGQTRGAMLGSISAQDMEINMSTGYDKVQTGGGSYLSVIGRQVSSGTNYRLDLRTDANGVLMAQLIRTVAGTETALATVGTIPGLTYSPGETLHIKFQVQGSGTTSLRAKVWKDGQVEPAAWTIQSTDSTTVLQAKGSAGFSNYLSGSATNGPIKLLIDEFEAKVL